MMIPKALMIYLRNGNNIRQNTIFFISKIISTQTKKPDTLCQALFFVAGVGLEPTTFGL
jgi:hypothetical protein